MPRLDIDEMLNAELETKYNKVEVPKGTNPFEKAKQTNADRIRSMTDEELAKFLCEASICKPTYCPAYDYCINQKKSMYEWLQKDSEV